MRPHFYALCPAFFLLFLALFFGPLPVLGQGFITRYEYAKMLYENPRGISCKLCHANGSAQILGYTVQNGRKVPVPVPDIRGLSLAAFAAALNTKSKSLMPSYSLTDDEIRALYDFITTPQKGQK